jgi:lycopene cyclase domain-containing protein
LTYTQFLLIFLMIPIVLLAWVMRREVSRRHIQMLALLSLVALIYTTPWDNHLVATRVWTYDPSLVLGITLGWVPLEEYLFFLLQPILAGLWLLYLYRRLPSQAAPALDRPGLRRGAVWLGGCFWLGALALLVVNWQPGRYLALELAWALPPILLQLAFGADILWSHRRRLIPTLLSLVLYLCSADALAITAGTWTINPAFSLPVTLGGVLPLEEFVFFLLTNALIVFSLGLLLAPESHNHLQRLYNTAFARHRSSSVR